jgi:hypothetical protein
MAMSIGKKIANTGASMVPRPKPEKKVSIEVANAARPIIKISIVWQFDC